MQQKQLTALGNISTLAVTKNYKRGYHARWSHS
jgi:hypothetical protein